MFARCSAAVVIILLISLRFSLAVLCMTEQADVKLARCSLYASSLPCALESKAS